jgi:hypothetical protein
MPRRRPPFKEKGRRSMSDKQDGVEPTTDEIRLATKGQTFGLFKFTQVDVRELEPVLEFDQASLLIMSALNLLSKAELTNVMGTRSTRSPRSLPPLLKQLVLQLMSTTFNAVNP